MSYKAEYENASKSKYDKDKVIDLLLEIEELDSKIFTDKLDVNVLKKTSVDDLVYMGSIAIQFMEQSKKDLITKWL